MRAAPVRRAVLAAGALAVVMAGMVPSGCRQATSPDRAKESQTMNEIAESYVKLVLALGAHDPGYVDAYYGPADWREQAEEAERPLPEIGADADALIARLQELGDGEDSMIRLRHQYLVRQLSAVSAYAGILAGGKLAFDDESRALYDAVAPTLPESHFQEVIDQLDQLLPGAGSLQERYSAFREAFIIPPDRLDAVFQAAIEEARRRTRRHIELPEDESFVVEYVTDKPWSGYNWYQGDGHSLIQVNTDFPTYIDRAVDLAAHEGYPGHHVYNVLLEKHMVKDRGWMEFTVYPLFSPQSLIAEGSANFGIDVAFPAGERTAFERDVLYGLAGLDPAMAEKYHRIVELAGKLDYAGNEAARGYLDGNMDAAQAARWLTTYAMMTPERAAQRIKFIETYRSYVINYNLGKDLVRRYIEARGGTEDRPQQRWDEFARLISSPRLPSGLGE